MTPGQLIDALHAAGATLVVEGGKTRVRGAKVPDELLAQIKAGKEAVLAEWQRRQDLNRDRFGCVPAADAPVLALKLDLTPRLREAVVQYCWRQPRPVHAFVMGRAEEYHRAGLPPQECDWRACCDVLAWQRNSTDVGAAVAWLAGIEECAADLKKPQISTDETQTGEPPVATKEPNAEEKPS
jgi:hypothetical protein